MPSEVLYTESGEPWPSAAFEQNFSRRLLELKGKITHRFGESYAVVSHDNYIDGAPRCHDFDIVNIEMRLAAAEGLVQAVQILVDHGADIHALDEDGFTALHLAAKEGRVETVRLLVKLGTVLSSKTSAEYLKSHTTKTGNTVLHSAASGPLEPHPPSAFSAETVLCLCELGADAHQRRGDDGYTALHVAACCGRSEAVQLLVQLGADLNARCGNERTPLLLAAFNGKADTVRQT